MKKLLSIVAISALLITGASATDNEILVQGEVEAGAVVALGAAPTANLVGNVFLFEGATIDLGKMALNSDTEKVIALHVKTNSNDGVKMSISDETNGGKLADGDKAKIDMAYKFGSSAFTVGGGALSLVDGTHDGENKAGDFIATASVDDDQESGNYATTLAVLIEAN